MSDDTRKQDSDEDIDKVAGGAATHPNPIDPIRPGGPPTHPVPGMPTNPIGGGPKTHPG